MNAHIKDLIREWCEVNEKLYGPDWKKIVAKEISEDLMKFPLGKQLQERLCQPSSPQDSLPTNSQNKNSNPPQS